MPPFPSTSEEPAAGVNHGGLGIVSTTAPTPLRQDDDNGCIRYNQT